VALLTLALQSAGVQAAGLNVHETGLRCAPATIVSSSIRSRCAPRSAHHSVVVVPGFLATRHHA
jgi:aspartokinase